MNEHEIPGAAVAAVLLGAVLLSGCDAQVAPAEGAGVGSATDAPSPGGGASTGSGQSGGASAAVMPPSTGGAVATEHGEPMMPPVVGNGVPDSKPALPAVASSCPDPRFHFCEDFESYQPGPLVGSPYTVIGLVPEVDDKRFAGGRKSLHVHAVNGTADSQIVERAHLPLPGNVMYGVSHPRTA